jgi:hypothetical protein
VAVAALPAGSADLIVVHPPWGVHTFSSSRATDNFAIGSEFHSVICAAREVLHPEGVLIVGVPEIIRESNTLLFCPQAVEATMANLNLHLDHVDFWLKVSAGGLHAGCRWKDSKCDKIVAHSILEWLMVFRNQRIKSWNRGRIMAFPIERDPVHPAPWPYKLGLELVTNYSRPNAHVVDLFMGRGTIARACASLGRRFTGFETRQEYFSRAQSYLKDNISFPTSETVRTVSSLNREA